MRVSDHAQRCFRMFMSGLDDKFRGVYRDVMVVVLYVRSPL